MFSFTCPGCFNSCCMRMNFTAGLQTGKPGAAGGSSWKALPKSADQCRPVRFVDSDQCRPVGFIDCASDQCRSVSIAGKRRPVQPAFWARSQAMTWIACWNFPIRIRCSISSDVWISIFRYSVSSKCCSVTLRQFFARYTQA